MECPSGQDSSGLTGHVGTRLASVQPAVNQQPQVPFLTAAFQTLSPEPVSVHGIVVTQVQDLALNLVECDPLDVTH